MGRRHSGHLYILDRMPATDQRLLGGKVQIVRHPRGSRAGLCRFTVRVHQAQYIRRQHAIQAVSKCRRSLPRRRPRKQPCRRCRMQRKSRSNGVPGGTRCQPPAGFPLRSRVRNQQHRRVSCHRAWPCPAEAKGLRHAYLQRQRQCYRLGQTEEMQDQATPRLQNRTTFPADRTRREMAA